MKRLLRKRLERIRSATTSHTAASSSSSSRRSSTKTSATQISSNPTKDDSEEFEACVVSLQQTRLVSGHMYRTNVDTSSHIKYSYLITVCIAPIIHHFADWVDYPKGDHILEGHTEWVYTALVSANGQRLYTGGVGNSIIVWDLLQNQIKLQWKAHTNAVRCLALHSGLLVSGSSDTTLRIWDAHSHALVRTLEGHSKDVKSVRFNQKGDTLLSGSHDKTIRLWSVKSGECVRVLRGHGHYVTSVLFMDNGLIVSGSWDESVKIWDAMKNIEVSDIYESKKSDDTSISIGSSDDESDCCVRTINENELSLVFALTVNSNRSRVACICGGSFVTFQWPIEGLGGNSDNDNGSESGYYSNDVELVNDDDNEEEKSGSLLTPIVIHEFCFSGCFHPTKDDILAVGFNSGWIKLYDMNNKDNQCIKSLEGHSDIVRDICFTPDGNRLISVSSDQSVRIWDVSSLNQ